MRAIAVALIVASVGFVSGALAQKPVRHDEESSAFRPDNTKPTIFITAERKGKRAPQESGESGNAVWLRLFNNSKWPIIFAVFEVSKELGDVGMYYDVEAKKGWETVNTPGSRVLRQIQVSEVPAGNPLPAFYNLYRLRPGKSVLFSVPAEHVAQNLLLRIRFSYGWEGRNAYISRLEPSHFVYFESPPPQSSSNKNSSP